MPKIVIVKFVLKNAYFSRMMVKCMSCRAFLKQIQPFEYAALLQTLVSQDAA